MTARTLMTSGSKIFTALVAAALIFTWTTSAQADGTAANKLAAAGSTVERFGPNTNVVLLNETMKVSSVRDLILQMSAECSIVTALDTADQTKKTTEGRIELWIEIDGRPVPVSADDTGDGRVVFCDRTYERQITDQEGENGAVDRERDYIRTRTANAFNWLALDAGTIYDDPANGNNILNIVVKADLVQTTNSTGCAIGQTCSEAIVGNRTLIVENTNAQNTEVITEQDPNPAPPPPAPCTTYPVCP